MKEINTPIYDFVSEYIDSDFTRLHMPGHKGRGPLGCEERDITEVGGADVLYSPTGIIKESEDNASLLFNTHHTYYSTEGSSLAIRAMLTAALKGRKSDTPPVILAARNAHKSFLYSLALLDIEVEWMYPESDSYYLGGVYTAQGVREALGRMKNLPFAVYLTSPDYLGNLADIEGISEVAKEYEIPLLVDNAHGAYLAFLDKSQHPISLGAAMCTDSAHKTLPVLTGGAYLHLSTQWHRYAPYIRESFSLFASTSPSYLILQSLDLCNRRLATDYPERLSECIRMIEGLKAALIKNGTPTLPSEPLKITLDAALFGMSGYQICDILMASKIVPEFADESYVVLMPSPSNTEAEIDHLREVLLSIKKGERKVEKPLVLSRPEKILSVREAIFSPSESIPVSCAVGRICADPSVSCPPAVPIAVSGERLSPDMISLFQRYGIEYISVVKE